MRGKKFFGIILAVSMSLSVTACGSSFPEMSEEEYKQTVEYAAGLLMRYSNNGQERLIYVDAKELEKQRKKEVQKAEQAEKEEKQTVPAPQPVTPVAEPETVTDVTEPVPDDTGQDTTALPVPEESATEASKEEQTTDTGSGSDIEADMILSADESQEIQDGIFLSYQGYMITSTYPESSKSYVVNADKGKKLLVLRFDLYNGTDGSKSVNMIPLNLLFQILLNGNNIGYSSVTFLPNDLASFSGTIDSRAHESVVVLTQINEKDASNIDSLGMIVTKKGQNQTISLR
ncbi:MAG: hypothetical protein IJU77_10340 [Butyrivibrio sp.]|nr:hypothetical protein [Butyrivibrio sp.]